MWLVHCRESCNEALDVMVENVTVLRAAQVVVGGGFGHKSVVVRTTVARLLDKIKQHSSAPAEVPAAPG